MRKFSKLASAAVLAVAVAGGSYAFLGSSLVPTVAAHLKDHPKLAKADENLDHAQHELKDLPDVFHGHKEKALHAIMEARTIISLIVKDEEQKLAPSEGSGLVPLVEHKHPHLWDAAEACKDAAEYIESHPGDFHGKKGEALEKIKKAEEELRICADEKE